MATLDKEAIARLIAEQTGSDFTADSLTDEMLAGIVVDDDDTDDDIDDDTDDTTDDTTDTATTTATTTDDDDDDDDFEVDVTKMTAGERMIYEMYMKSEKKRKEEKIMSLINSSGVGEIHRSALVKMVKAGVGQKEISEMVESFKQVENATTRVLGTTGVMPKGKVKFKTKKKEDTIKYGTKEFGKMLAERI